MCQHFSVDVQLSVGESDDLTAAMTELAKSELAFTNENTRDGKRIYIVDSVRLTEDEVILLHEKRGAIGTSWLAGIRNDVSTFVTSFIVSRLTIVLAAYFVIRAVLDR